MGSKIRLSFSNPHYEQTIFCFSCEEHFEEMNDFKKFYIHLIQNTLDTIVEKFKNRFSDFTKIEIDFSNFTQSLTISVENVSIADLQLELCDL